MLSQIDLYQQHGQHNLKEAPVNRRIFWVCAIVLSCLSSTFSQQLASKAPIESGVPRLVSFGGMLYDPSGKPRTGITGMTFAIYKDQFEGAALWMETQSVVADMAGHYTAQLGSTRSGGLPVDLFASGEARWLGVQVSGQAEQPRVLLLSVPYALKAGDAATVGGLPPSAFVLAVPASATIDAPGSVATPASSAVASVPPPATITGSGAVNFVPLFKGAATIGNSAVFQSGTSPTAKIGINTSAPATTLDVKGAGTFRGALTLPATAPATASAGKTSQPLNLVASSFNSTAGTPLNQTFRLQSEPAGNNTAATGGTLNLLYASGANAAAETGLKIASTGQITFAPGQIFPGTGTVKSVGLTAPASDFSVSGSPVTGTGALGLTWKTAPTSADTANAIVKRDATGSIKVTNINSSGGFSTFTAIPTGVLVNSSAPNAIAVQADATSVSGKTLGIIGATESADTGSAGIWGQANNSSAGAGVTQGVAGVSYSAQGIGVVGYLGVLSSHFSPGVLPAGVWGDGGVAGAGVFATSDGFTALYASNKSAGYPTLDVTNGDPSGLLINAYDSSSAAGGYCLIRSSGDLECSGSKSAVVPVKDGRQVALYAVESPENWFEDFGSARLANGMVTVKLDPTFGETVNLQIDYHVFLTPKGDCKGLYVGHETSGSFEVRELGGGTSSVAFDYRIVAKRLGYESKRLVDMQPVLDKLKSGRLKRNPETTTTVVDRKQF